MNLWFIIDHQLPGYPGSFYLCRVTLSMHKLPWKNIPLLIFEPGCVDYEQYRDCLVFINSGVRLQNMDTWTSNILPTGRNAKVELMCCRRSKLRMSISGRVTSINLHTYSESVYFARSFYIRIDNWFWHESPEMTIIIISQQRARISSLSWTSDCDSASGIRFPDIIKMWKNVKIIIHLHPISEHHKLIFISMMSQAAWFKSITIPSGFLMWSFRSK